MYKIGLTGSIGSGKSTVSKIVVKRGIQLIDADEISRNITSGKSPLISELQSAFGPGILNEDGTLNRTKTAEMAFATPSGLQKLTSVVTEKVKEIIQGECDSLEKEGEKLLFMDIPLLFENNMSDSFDEVWSVVADTEIRYKRANERDGISREDFDARDRSQVPQKTKMEQSDVVFLNDGTMDELANKVKREINRVIFFSGWLNR